MAGPSYVSDPRIWKTFYKNMLDGQFNPRNYKGRQSRSGIAGMYSKKPYMIPVNPHVTVEEPKGIVGKQVTPIAAVEERVKGELKDEIRENIPHVPVGSIKAGDSQIPPISIRNRKRKKKSLSDSGKKLKTEEKKSWHLIYFRRGKLFHKRIWLFLVTKLQKLVFLLNCLCLPCHLIKLQ